MAKNRANLPPMQERPVCQMCNKHLQPKHQNDVGEWVYKRTYKAYSVQFCSDLCAGEFAFHAHKAGYRIKRKVTGEREQ
jgi:uncharacterized protein with PIN domain